MSLNGVELNNLMEKVGKKNSGNILKMSLTSMCYEMHLYLKFRVQGVLKQRCISYQTDI